MAANVFADLVMVALFQRIWRLDQQYFFSHLAVATFWLYKIYGVTPGFSDILIKLDLLSYLMSKVHNYTVLIEQDEDGVYVAKVPDIAGCYTQGKSVEEVMVRIKEAIEVCLEAEKEQGYKPLKFIGIQQIEVASA